MTPRTVPIICAKAPRHIVYVPAVRYETTMDTRGVFGEWRYEWRCSWCGARVKVVAREEQQ